MDKVLGLDSFLPLPRRPVTLLFLLLGSAGVRGFVPRGAEGTPLEAAVKATCRPEEDDGSAKSDLLDLPDVLPRTSWKFEFSSEAELELLGLSLEELAFTKEVTRTHNQRAC